MVGPLGIRALTSRLASYLTSLALALLVLPASAADRVGPESGVKAALVYNLLLFVQWPEDKLPSDGSLNLCVLASSAMEDAFNALVGKPVHSRPLSIRRMPSSSEEVRSCHAVWVDESHGSALTRLALAARSNGILVLSEGPSALAQGAMIAVSNEGGRMVFSVDNGAARDARLMVSSKLLRLARGVVDKNRE